MIGIDTTFLVQLEIQELPAHRAAHQLLHHEVLEPKESMALAPQVLAELIHVATDPRRFQRPLSMEEALAKAQFWWEAVEVQQIFPTAEATRLFFEWMNQHRLGRKRVLDTQLAATLRTAGVRRLLTANPADFQVFGVFELISP